MYFAVCLGKYDIGICSRDKEFRAVHTTGLQLITLGFINGLAHYKQNAVHTFTAFAVNRPKNSNFCRNRTSRQECIFCLKGVCHTVLVLYKSKHSFPTQILFLVFTGKPQLCKLLNSFHLPG